MICPPAQGSAAYLFQRAAQFRLEQNDQNHSAVVENIAQDPVQGSQSQKAADPAGKHQHDQALQNGAGPGFAGEHDQLVQNEGNHKDVQSICKGWTVKDIPNQIFDLIPQISQRVPHPLFMTDLLLEKYPRSIDYYTTYCGWIKPLNGVFL